MKFKVGQKVRVSFMLNCKSCGDYESCRNSSGVISQTRETENCILPYDYRVVFSKDLKTERSECLFAENELCFQFGKEEEIE